MPPGLPGALHELQSLTLRLAEHGRALRTAPAGFSEPEHKAARKEARELEAKRGEIKTATMLVKNSLRRCGASGTGTTPHPCPENDYDHEREGALTSGVTDLIVVAPATEPFSCDIAVRSNV